MRSATLSFSAISPGQATKIHASPLDPALGGLAYDFEKIVQ